MNFFFAFFRLALTIPINNDLMNFTRVEKFMGPYNNDIEYQNKHLIKDFKHSDLSTSLKILKDSNSKVSFTKDRENESKPEYQLMTNQNLNSERELLNEFETWYVPKNHRGEGPKKPKNEILKKNNEKISGKTYDPILFKDKKQKKIRNRRNSNSKSTDLPSFSSIKEKIDSKNYEINYLFDIIKIENESIRKDFQTFINRYNLLIGKFSNIKIIFQDQNDFFRDICEKEQKETINNLSNKNEEKIQIHYGLKINRIEYTKLSKIKKMNVIDKSLDKKMKETKEISTFLQNIDNFAEGLKKYKEFHSKLVSGLPILNRISTSIEEIMMLVQEKSNERVEIINELNLIISESPIRDNTIGESLLNKEKIKKYLVSNQSLINRVSITMINFVIEINFFTDNMNNMSSAITNQHKWFSSYIGRFEITEFSEENTNNFYHEEKTEFEKNISNKNNNFNLDLHGEDFITKTTKNTLNLILQDFKIIIHNFNYIMDLLIKEYLKGNIKEYENEINQKDINCSGELDARNINDGGLNNFILSLLEENKQALCRHEKTVNNTKISINKYKKDKNDQSQIQTTTIESNIDTNEAKHRSFYTNNESKNIKIAADSYNKNISTDIGDKNSSSEENGDLLQHRFLYPKSEDNVSNEKDVTKVPKPDHEDKPATNVTEKNISSMEENSEILNFQDTNIAQTPNTTNSTNVVTEKILSPKENQINLTSNFPLESVIEDSNHFQKNESFQAKEINIENNTNTYENKTTSNKKIQETPPLVKETINPSIIGGEGIATSVGVETETTTNFVQDKTERTGTDTDEEIYNEKDFIIELVEKPEIVQFILQEEENKNMLFGNEEKSGKTQSSSSNIGFESLKVVVSAFILSMIRRYFY